MKTGFRLAWAAVAMAVAIAMTSGSPSPARAQTSATSGVRSPEAIRETVEALREKDVAWRQVEWRTCLLDGLAESLRTKKPLMLWIFIDRPIDDERC